MVLASTFDSLAAAVTDSDRMSSSCGELVEFAYWRKFKGPLDEGKYGGYTMY